MERPIIRRIGTVAAATALALGLAACAEDEGAAIEEAEPTETDEQLVGDVVTIEGDIVEVIAPTAFTLGRAETLVLSATEFETDLVGGEFAVVTGTVIDFRLPDVEAQLGVEFDDPLFAEFENEMAVLANSVHVFAGD